MKIINIFLTNLSEQINRIVYDTSLCSEGKVRFLILFLNPDIQCCRTTILNLKPCNDNVYCIGFLLQMLSCTSEKLQNAESKVQVLQ